MKKGGLSSLTTLHNQRVAIVNMRSREKKLYKLALQKNLTIVAGRDN